VALLLIILALLAFLGIGSGSTGTSPTHAEPQRSQPLMGTDCVHVTWEAGQPAHVRKCHKAPAKP
jgi:hypothetical protein